MSLREMPIINSIRDALREIGPLRRTVVHAKQAALRRRRMREIAEVLRLTFREHLDVANVIKDYRYSIELSDRQCVQVLLLEDILTFLASEGLKGALVECGVYTGGASAYMLRSALRNLAFPLPAYWGFDSFQGMPHATPADGERGLHWLVDKGTALDGKLEGTTIMRSDKGIVAAYLRGTGYPEKQIHLISGWFQDTLSVQRENIGPIALLRLDGDLYESTKVCLRELAGLVVPNGVIIFDDYGAFEGCKKAVDEFLDRDTRFTRVFRFDAHQAWIVRIG